MNWRIGRSAEKYTPEILDKLIATGYLHAVYDVTNPDKVGSLVAPRHDVLFHLMEKVSTGLMGLTMGCARCHSHKYDPDIAEGLLPHAGSLCHRL